MEWIKQFFGNFMLVSGISAWLIAQLLKIPTGVFRSRKVTLRAILFGNGGMPSSHSATVCALTCAAAISQGLASAAFAISCVLSIIVMTDAVGVRRETGEQGKALNRIIEEFPPEHMDGIPQNFKELVGHTPFQVSVGAAVGIAVPLLLRLIPWFAV